MNSVFCPPFIFAFSLLLSLTECNAERRVQMINKKWRFPPSEMMKIFLSLIFLGCVVDVEIVSVS